jgi:hypothetical protein
MDVLFVCLFSLPEAPVPKLVGVEWVHFPWALQADWSCDCSHSFSLSRVVALLMSIAVITMSPAAPFGHLVLEQTQILPKLFGNKFPIGFIESVDI